MSPERIRNAAQLVGSESIFPTWIGLPKDGPLHYEAPEAYLFYFIGHLSDTLFLNSRNNCVP